MTSYGGSGGDERRSPDLGIRLPLEQVLRVPRKHLVHRHDERAGRIVAAVRLEGRGRPAHPHAAPLQPVHQPRGRQRIVIHVRANQDGRRIPLAPVLDRRAVHFINLPQQRLPPIRDAFQERHRGNEFVVDDVAQRPSAAEPRPRIFGARHRVARRRPADVGILHLAPRLRRVRRRSARRRAAPVSGRRCSVGESRCAPRPPRSAGRPGCATTRSTPSRPARSSCTWSCDDPVLAGGLEGRPLHLAENPVPPVDERMHIRIDRIGGRHDEDPRAGAALLVLVEPHRGNQSCQSSFAVSRLSTCVNMYMSRLLSWPTYG